MEHRSHNFPHSISKDLFCDTEEQILSEMLVEKYVFFIKSRNEYIWLDVNQSLMFQPREIRLASGRKLTYIYDSDGGLEKVKIS